MRVNGISSQLGVVVSGQYRDQCTALDFPVNDKSWQQYDTQTIDGSITEKFPVTGLEIGNDPGFDQLSRGAINIPVIAVTDQVINQAAMPDEFFRACGVPMRSRYAGLAHMTA